MFTQLTGRVPVLLDGLPCQPGAQLSSGDELEIGASRLQFRVQGEQQRSDAGARESSGGGSLVPADGDPWRRVVRRGPVLDRPVDHSGLQVPEHPATYRAPPPTALIGGAVAVLGAIVIASVFGQPMFALFAMVGAIASTATWVVGAVSARRKRRRANIEFRQQVEGFRSALRRACNERRERHLRRHRSVVGLLCDLEQSTGRIWERRVNDNWPLVASIGIGTSRWEVPLTASDRGSLLPNWTGWLPHARRGTGDQLIARADDTGAIQRLLESVGQADGGPVLVVVDDPAVLALRTGPLRRYLATASPVCLVIVPTDSTVPAVCQRVLTLGSTGGAHWAGEVPATDQATDIRIAGLDECTAEEAARTLSALIDPEGPDVGGASIPRSVQLADVFPAHGLIAGTTGAGKSELLRTLVVSLAARLSPDHLTFVLVDYKGGSTFDVCSDLPHTVGVVTDLDDGLAERALVSLEAELIRRERLIRAVGANDLAEYRVAENVQTLPRLVVVIDEFAALAKELPDFLAALVGVAQRGRSLGIHLLLATQRPTGVVNDDIRANTNLRIALRLHDPADAKDVVGDELPATFPRGVPGRVALRLGPDELVVFQAARCTGAVQETAQHLRVQWPRSAVPG
ncbi:MAG: hypothetical protein IZT58_12285, partial [Actinobacteria bacterium]|nr:hypothetical protein [Actinomycetota bacterium]